MSPFQNHLDHSQEQHPRKTISLSIQKKSSFTSWSLGNLMLQEGRAVTGQQQGRENKQAWKGTQQHEVQEERQAVGTPQCSPVAGK
jgi:hypothetical protein